MFSRPRRGGAPGLRGAYHFGSDSPGTRDRKMRCGHQTRGTVHQRSRTRQTRPTAPSTVLSLASARVSELSPAKVRLARLKEVPKMAARNRHESLTWGLLILVLGVLLQIHYLRPELQILRNLWKFWPVLLIVAGLNRLFRYFSSRSAIGGEPPK